MRRCALFLIGLLLLTQLPVAKVHSQDATPTPGAVTGRVSGHVVNLTPGGGDSLAGVPVVLYALEDFGPRETYSTTVTSDGNFLFDPIGLVAGYSYIATLEYQQVTYGSSFIDYDGGEEALELDIEVYEAVTSLDSIVISRLHVLVDFAEGRMQVSELYIFDNNGDRVFTGPSGNPDEGTLEIAIPDGVSRATVERAMGEDMVSASSSVFEVEGGFMDTLPVRPGKGSQQLMVTYELAYGDEASVAHALPYPASSVSLILPDIGLGVESDLLSSAGQRSMQGTSFIEWEAADVPAGEILSFRISGTPDLEALAAMQSGETETTSEPVSTESPLVVRAGDNATTWAIAVGSLMLAAGVTAFLWNRSRGALAEDRRRELLQAIVELDSNHEQGVISASRYEFEREMLKAELRAWYEET